MLYNTIRKLRPLLLVIIMDGQRYTETIRNIESTEIDRLENLFHVINFLLPGAQ